MFLLVEKRGPARDFGGTYAQNPIFARRGKPDCPGQRRVFPVHRNRVLLPPLADPPRRGMVAPFQAARGDMQTTTLTIAPELFWGLAALAGLLALTAVVFGALSLVANDRVSPVERMRDALGLTGLNGGLFFLALCLWSAIFLSLVAGLLWVIWSVAWAVLPSGQAALWNWRFTLAQMVALTGVLGAVVALPFTLVRIRLTRDQTAISDQLKRIADEALFNDKIKAAADDLHARRQIKRKSRLENPDEPDFIEDDIMRRVTAIDRLQGLAQERPDEAPRITRMLCVYLRHLSKGIGPDNEEHPRADMEAAAQTIGRMKMVPGVEADKIEIDLRGANLAGFDLSGLCFDGADFRSAELSGASLAMSSLAKAFLPRANLRKADLRWTILCCVDFTCADLSKAWFNGANCSGTNFSNPTLEKSEIHLSRSIRGAAVRIVEYTDFDKELANKDDVFADGTLLFPSDADRPVHWPMEALETADFNKQWRAWQKEIGFDPDDPATW